MGAAGEEGAPGNVWRTSGTWPPEGGVDTFLYLNAGGVLGLDPPADEAGGDAFAYDPGHPTPTLGGANLSLVAGMVDQREVEARDDVLVYTTPSLEHPLEATGDLAARVWITTDVPDTDIAVRLTDVYPDGRSMLVSDGILRARYHNCPEFRCEDLLEPGEPVQLSIDLGPHSYVFNAGHSIRVSVTSSNVPRFAPNPNTGAAFLEEGEAGRVAHTVVLHDADHPSALILPVMEGE
jgi:putative CocE/NonD family hydrolase